MDSDLGDLNMESLLNSDAAKHRLSIKPKKNHFSSHQRSVSPQRPLPKPDEKYVNSCLISTLPLYKIMQTLLVIIMVNGQSSVGSDILTAKDN